MEYSKIQWCDDTENPVMGCDGCELWPKVAAVVISLVILIHRYTGSAREQIRECLDRLVEPYESATVLWHRREDLIDKLRESYADVPAGRWKQVIEQEYRCYAGVLHLGRGGRPGSYDEPVVSGYAGHFESPWRFPGRMGRTAKRGDLRGQVRPKKPWLDAFPRLIFVSDMGDALSAGIDFDHLKTEIIDVVGNPDGRRHVWLWLTKRPKRMAEFAEWFSDKHGIEWPDNLVAMTSVTNRATRSRVDQLRKVPARFRGLSVEPLIESVHIDLEGIDWLIVGGESGKFSREFDIEWARSLRGQCRDNGTAFFVKQLGANPVEDGFPIELLESHGGDWSEWPADLRVRELPGAMQFPFSEVAPEDSQLLRDH